MQELREMLRRELDKVQRKGSMSAGDLDLMYKVVDIIKDSYEIEEYAEAEHSHAGGGHGGMSRVYMDGGEYGAVLRAKGIVAGQDGQWIHFDYVPGEENVRTGSAAVIGKLCVIGSQLDEAGVAALFGV